MASRLLARSKALALALSRADAAAPGPAAGVQWLRTLSSLPRDPAAAASPPPAPRQPAVGSPLGLSKVDLFFPRFVSLQAYGFCELN